MIVIKFKTPEIIDIPGAKTNAVNVQTSLYMVNTREIKFCC